MYWFLLGACVGKGEDTADYSVTPETTWENGFCEEPEMSGIRSGTIDCQNNRCQVDAGSFWMGSSMAEDECPIHSVELSTFWIDATEVTIGQWMDCRTFGDCTPLPDHCQNSLEQREDYASDLPVICTTWEQAETYCSWRGGRLPTEAEWEKAARGTEGATWAWGAIAPTCEEANFRLASFYCYGGMTSPVKYFTESRSAYGLWDTNGNVFEWTADFYDARSYQSDETQDPRGTTDACFTTVDGRSEPCHYRVIRGGAYNTTEDVIRSSARSFAEPMLIDLNIGFRCAYDSAQ